jgi:hypothetical protein
LHDKTGYSLKSNPFVLTQDVFEYAKSDIKDLIDTLEEKIKVASREAESLMMKKAKAHAYHGGGCQEAAEPLA